MVVILRSNDIVSDSRVQKYIKFLDNNSIHYKLIGWDRDNVMTDTYNSVFLKFRSGHNVGGIKAIKGRIIWMRFVLSTLLSMKLKETTLHACDLDSAFPAAIYKMLIYRKRTLRLIFDIFDWYTDTIPNQGKILKIAFGIMERISVWKSDNLIICEPERREQIPFSCDEKKLTVLANVPGFTDSSFLTPYDEKLFDNGKLIFCYVGGFVVKRCIEEIITIAENGEVNLAIAGFGNVEIEDRLKKLNGLGNIKFFGRVKYEDGLRLMYNSDIVYAMYSPEIKNNIYAAPNKFYEAMFVGKPLFTTSGTKVGEKTVNLSMGFIAKGNITDIQRVIESITSEDIKQKAQNSARLWAEKYSNYTNNFMKNEYSKMI